MILLPALSDHLLDRYVREIDTSVNRIRRLHRAWNGGRLSVVLLYFVSIAPAGRRLAKHLRGDIPHAGAATQNDWCNTKILA
jgi:hypothetical protein